MSEYEIDLSINSEKEEYYLAGLKIRVIGPFYHLKS